MKLIYLIGFMCFPPDAYNELTCTPLKQQHETVAKCIKQGNDLDEILKDEGIRDYHFKCVEYDNNNKNNGA